LGQGAAKLRQTAFDALARMGDNRDPGHASALRERTAASAARAAAIATSSDPTPTRTAAATSVGWCMPRYIRENATSAGIAIAIVQTPTRMREVMSSAMPQ